MSITVESGRWRHQICPDCAKEKLAIDPRKKDPTASVVEQVCWTHLIVRKEISPSSHRIQVNPETNQPPL